MRLLHLSDLHLGKRVNEFSMIEDQRYILRKVLEIIDKEKPDGVMIAGDIYDKSAPNEEAVKLLGRFLSRLASRKQQVFIISGIHDSAVKLAFASDLIDHSGIHFSPVYEGRIEPLKLENNGSEIYIYMLPFVRPITVKSIFPEEAETIKNYSDACQTAIRHMDIDKTKCNNLRQGLPVRIRRIWAAGLIMLTSQCLTILTMLPWGIFTDRRAWDGTRFDTAEHRSNTHFLRQITINP